MLVEEMLETLQDKLRTGEIRLLDDVEVSAESALDSVSVQSVRKISGTAVAFTITGRLCGEEICSADDEFGTDDEIEELEEAVDDLKQRVKSLRKAMKQALDSERPWREILEEALEEDDED